jgi:hypothetical protein
LIECPKDDTKTGDKTGDNPGDPPKKGYMNYIIIGVLVFAAIAVIGGIVCVLYMNSSKKDGGNEQVSALPSAAPSAAPSTVSAERSGNLKPIIKTCHYFTVMLNSFPKLYPKPPLKSPPLRRHPNKQMIARIQWI